MRAGREFLQCWGLSNTLPGTAPVVGLCVPEPPLHQLAALPTPVCPPLVSAMCFVSWSNPAAPCSAVAFLAAFFQFPSGHFLSCFLVQILVRLDLVILPWTSAGTQFTRYFFHLPSCGSSCILVQTLFPLVSPLFKRSVSWHHL